MCLRVIHFKWLAVRARKYLHHGVCASQHNDQGQQTLDTHTHKETDHDVLAKCVYAGCVNAPNKTTAAG